MAIRYGRSRRRRSIGWTRRIYKVMGEHVPGVLNKTADVLSRLEQGNEWEKALKKVADKWGSLESVSWSGSRTLLKPDIRRIPEAIGLLELVVDDEERQTPPSFWDACTVIITPTWQKAIWWNALERLRVDWLDLGKIQDQRLRNGHDPSGLHL